MYNDIILYLLISELTLPSMPCPQQKFNILLASSAVALIAWQYVSQRRLQRLLAHEVEKREADYKGRIRSQRKAREQVKGDINERGGQLMKHIGVVESPFPDRRGTPRQPLLVPSAHGRIRFDRALVQVSVHARAC